MTVVWERYDDAEETLWLEARQLRPGGELGPVITLVGGTSDLMCRALPGQASTFVWERRAGGSLVGEARTVAANGSFGPTVSLYTLATTDLSPSGSLSLAGGPGGQVVAMWESAGLRARVVSATGHVGPALLVSDTEPDLIATAVGQAGDAVFAWQANPSGTVLARRLLPDGTLTDPVRVADSGGDWIKTAVADGGIATVAWGAGPWWTSPPGDVHARRLNVDGTLGGPDVLVASAAAMEDIAANAGGGTEVMLSSLDTSPAMKVRRLDAAGVLMTPRVVVARSRARADKMLVADDGAITLLAGHYEMYSHKYGTSPRDTGISVHRISADGAVSELADLDGIMDGDVATDSAGAVTAVWTCGWSDNAWIVIARERADAKGTLAACNGRAHDAQAPRITGLRARPRVRAVQRPPRLGRYPATLLVRLSEPAALQIRLERRRHGHWQRAGVLRIARWGLKNRTARIGFTGQIARGKPVRIGRYRATVRAIDDAGNRSAPRQARFRVTRR